MGNGRLYYIIGASGSGKDSLIDYARNRLAAEMNIIFAHRYITRASDAGGENHIALSKEEFQQRVHCHCFAMHWYSHNTHYGIGTEIEHWMSNGLDVVVNGSRAYLNEAMQRFPQIVPIWVHVSLEKLRIRLQQRGRESVKEIEERLVLAQQLEHIAEEKGLQQIDNNRPIDEAGEQLITLLTRGRQQQCA